MSDGEISFLTAGVTHTGKVRTNNEDAILARPETRLWAVADGMGGHDDGEWASQCLVEHLSPIRPGNDFECDLDSVAGAIHRANAAIHAEAVAGAKRMGSTIVAMLAAGSRFAVFWVGDSRVYLLRNGQLIRLTKDHSHVQDMVDAGRLTPQEAEAHPMGNVITRAIGVGPEVELDAIVDEAQAGDLFVLCSDGLTDVVSDPDLASAALLLRPDAVVDALLNLCLDRGAPDNVSIVAVLCEDARRGSAEGVAR
jgi:serine/threonine protein phosphatase PrpC